MNKAQLNLALEQSLKTQKSGKIWTAIGSGMLVGGAILTTQGINELSNSDNLKFGTFGTGLLIMSFSGFPLGYGLISWLSGKEKANMIEIELLASGKGHLEFKPGKYGLGLALSF